MNERTNEEISYYNDDKLLQSTHSHKFLIRIKNNLDLPYF